MKLVPLGDRVVLKQLVAEETTKSGIVYPDRQRKNLRKRKLWQLAPESFLTAKKLK